VPLARIDLRAGKPADYRAAVGDVVYTALVDVFGVPPNDRFQVIAEHAADGLIYDPAYLGINRTDDVILIQITLNEGRTVEQKQAFYAAVATGIHERVGLRLEDVFINLIEVKKENWSFGNGVAQYA
jgi:phenylpyruvate tautomerase PptA (4-oxalocrotonate tautomerase family)